jgi:hypothetical protein
MSGEVWLFISEVCMLIRLILLFLILDWFFNLLFNGGHYWFRWW